MILVCLAGHIVEEIETNAGSWAKLIIQLLYTWAMGFKSMNDSTIQSEMVSLNIRAEVNKLTLVISLLSSMDS